MVGRPGDYRWSSWHFYGEGRREDILRPHPLYLTLGTEDHGRRAAYRALFDAEMDQGVLAAIREAIGKSWPLGNDRFREELAARSTAPPPRGRPGKPGNPTVIQGELQL
jgi:putative transposase